MFKCFGVKPVIVILIEKAVFLILISYKIWNYTLDVDFDFEFIFHLKFNIQESLFVRILIEFKELYNFIWDEFMICFCYKMLMDDVK